MWQKKNRDLSVKCQIFKIKGAKVHLVRSPSYNEIWKYRLILSEMYVEDYFDTLTRFQTLNVHDSKWL